MNKEQQHNTLSHSAKDSSIKKKPALWYRVILFLTSFSGWILVAILFGIVSIGVVLNLPSVQQKITQRISVWFSEEIGYKVTVGYTNIAWLNAFWLKDVVVTDFEGDTIVNAKGIRMEFSWSELLRRNVHIQHISLSETDITYNIGKDMEKKGSFIDFVQSIVEWSDGNSGPPLIKRAPPENIIDEVELFNCGFFLNDIDEGPIPNQFDYYHPRFTKVNGCITLLRFRADTIDFYADQLKAFETTAQLPIKSLSTKFRYTKKNMELAKLQAYIGDSYLQDYVKFYYKSTDDFQDFNNKVKMKINLKKSKIYSKDIAKFAPALAKYNEFISLEGKALGTVNNFKSDDFTIGFGSNSVLQGAISMKGLPEWENTFINLNLEESTIQSIDLVPFLPGELLTATSKFETSSLMGTFKGYPSDFETNINWQSGIGNIAADFKIQLLNDKPIQYDGSFSTSNFQYGVFSSVANRSNAISGKGSIIGEGLDLQSLNASIISDIQQLSFNGYNYQNILSDVQIQNEILNGELSISDSALAFDLRGLVNLAKDKESVFVRGTISNSNPDKLGLISNIQNLRTNVDLAFTGLDIDNVIGKANFYNSVARINNQVIEVDSILLNSEKKDGKRHLTLYSGLMDADIQGDFRFSELIDNITRIALNYRAELFPEYAVKNYSFYEGDISKVSLESVFYLKDINNTVQGFVPDFKIAKNSKLEVSLLVNGQEQVAINLLSDTLAYGKYKFFGNNLDFVGSKNNAQNNSKGALLASLFVDSEAQELSNYFTKNLVTNATWSGNTINFRSNIEQSNSSNKATIKGNFVIEPTVTHLVLEPSDIRILDKQWAINKDDKIDFYSDGHIDIQNLSFYNNNQSISFEGIVGKNTNDLLETRVQNLDLSTISPLIEQDLSGKMNGLLVTGGLRTKNISLSSSIEVDSFGLEGTLIGKIVAQAAWDSLYRVLSIEGNLEKEALKTITFSGNYSPDNEVKTLNINAQLKSTPIKWLQPFLDGIVSNIEGEATGKINIGGNLSDIGLSGEVNVNGGRFKVPYLNTVYSFNNRVKIRPKLIDFSGTTLLDEQGSKALINNGLVEHNNWKDWYVNITGAINNFEVLNTNEVLNPVFYGHIYATGSLGIVGPADDLKITASVSNNRNSVFTLPINDEGGISDNASISFINGFKTDSSKSLVLPLSNRVDLSGISLEFNMDINSDLDMEIIFDKRTGEKIKANGSGKLKMLFDTRSDLELFGTYTVDRGAYNFTLSNAINKKFNLLSGSTLRFSGSPFNANIDIQALHEIYANLTPLITYQGEDRQQVLSQPQYRRKYLTQVLLNISGQLLAPAIKMDIAIKETPQDQLLVTAINNFQSLTSANEAILNNQILWLFLFRSFAPLDNNAADGGGNLATGTISEVLSNQFSNWLSQVDENFQIQLDVNGLDAAAINNLQLRLSYALLDGRLRVTRSGGFTNAMNTTTSQSIAGDWTLEYKLNNAGSLWVKGFTRNNQMILTTVNTNNTTQGISLSHTASFDDFSEVFKKRKKKQTVVIPISPEEVPKNTENDKNAPLLSAPSSKSSPSESDSSERDNGASPINRDILLAPWRKPE